MDLRTNIQINSETNLGPIQGLIKELNKATMATQLLSKAQQLLGKNMGAINDFTETYVFGLQDLIDAAKEIPGLFREISSEQERVNKLFESFTNSNSLPTYTQFTESAKELANNINDTSRATGIAVNDMSKLANFAHQNGLEFDTLNDLLVTLAQNLGELARGDGEDMEKALQALGVSSKDASGKVREALPVFLDISRAFDKYEDGVTKSALAGKFFDEEGTKYIGAISKAHRGFNELNPIMGDSFVAVVQSAGRASKDLNLAFSQLGAEIGTRLMPITTAITNIVTQFINTLLQIPKPIKDIIFYIGLTIASLGTILFVIKTVTIVVLAFQFAWGGAALALKGFAAAMAFVKTVPAAATAIGLLTKAVGLLTNAIQAAATWILKIPLATLIANLLGVSPVALKTAANLGLIKSAIILLFNPITAFIAGIVAIGVALYASSKDFRDWVNSIGRMVGDELYTYIVGASVMFKQFVADVGTQLSRVGQGLTDFFGNRVMPVLASVVEGLVTMFNGFFGWIFDGFNAVAGKVIDLYNVLPEAVRNVLGQIGSFGANIISNMPIFKETQALIQFLKEVRQRGLGARYLRGREIDMELMNPTRIRKPTLPGQKPEESKTPTKPRGRTPTEPRGKTPTEPPKDTAEQRQKKYNEAVKDFTSSLRELTKDIDQYIEDLKVKVSDLIYTLKQTLLPFDNFVKSNNKILDSIKSREDVKFPTMAETIRTKYTQLFEEINLEFNKIKLETSNNIVKKLDELREKYNDISQKFMDATEGQVPPGWGGFGVFPPEEPNNQSPGIQKQTTPPKLTDTKLTDTKLTDNLKNIQALEQITELIKKITPELQKDFENILNPQLEQLKTAQENNRVLQETVTLMKTGLNPEAAKTLALTNIEKESRKESLEALKETLTQAKSARDILVKLGGSEESVKSLNAYITLLERTEEQWGSIGTRIDEAAKRTKDLENQQKQLTETQERNKQIAQGLAQAIGQGLGQVFDLLFTKTENWGQALLDISAGILKTIADQLFQIMVIAPIVKSLTSTFGGWLGVRFAQGGVMTDRGPMPLKTYARGGIATSPQLALFGEGRMPEAFVPLPDGRRIPVAMQGNGGGGGDNISVNVSVDASGSQVSGNPGQGDQLGRAIAQAVQSEIVKQKRPGGLLYA